MAASGDRELGNPFAPIVLPEWADPHDIAEWLTMDWSLDREEPWANVEVAIVGVDSEVGDVDWGTEPHSALLTAFGIVKAICAYVTHCETVTPTERMSVDSSGRRRRTICIDYDVRKPLCRLYLFDSPWQIGLFDGSRNRPGGSLKETRFEISSVEDIFSYGEQLMETALRNVIPAGYEYEDEPDFENAGSHTVYVDPTQVLTRRETRNL